MTVATGVRYDGSGFYKAEIRVNGKNYYLLRSYRIHPCIRVRKLAEEARANNTFDAFYAELVKQRNRAYRR